MSPIETRGGFWQPDVRLNEQESYLKDDQLENVVRFVVLLESEKNFMTKFRNENQIISCTTVEVAVIIIIQQHCNGIGKQRSKAMLMRK